MLTLDGETLETTAEHPFYVVETNEWSSYLSAGKWIDAGDLQVGDDVRRADGSTGEVRSMQVVQQSQRMYNLTVDQAHTFFVGAGQWLVHNAGCGFAKGTAISALTEDRLQHASRHLTDAGLLPNWSKATGQQFVELATNILENPTHTFDHVLGGTRVRGFAGVVDNQNVVIFVFKEGKNSGKVASAVVPTQQQLLNWGM